MEPRYGKLATCSALCTIFPESKVRCTGPGTGHWSAHARSSCNAVRWRFGPGPRRQHEVGSMGPTQNLNLTWCKQKWWAGKPVLSWEFHQTMSFGNFLAGHGHGSLNLNGEKPPSLACLNHRLFLFLGGHRCWMCTKCTTSNKLHCKQKQACIVITASFLVLLGQAHALNPESSGQSALTLTHCHDNDFHVWWC